MPSINGPFIETAALKIFWVCGVAMGAQGAVQAAGASARLRLGIWPVLSLQIQIRK
jgi:hypothetical protein